MPDRDSRIREKYTKHPVWIFYWCWFESRTKYNLREFRKTIIINQVDAARHDRMISAEPMIVIAKIMDKYKTWTKQ